MRFLAELSFDNQLRAGGGLGLAYLLLVCLGMAPSTHGQDQS